MSKLKLLCWLLILALLAGGAAAVAWRSGLLGKRYTAVARLLVERCEPHVLSQAAEKYDPDEFENYRETQIELFKSPYVLTAALRNPKVKGQPSIERADAQHNAVEWLEKHISVECPNPRSGVLTVSLTSSDPQEAAVLVNAVVEAYVNEVINADRQRRRERLSDLQQIAAEKENEVRTRREQLKRELENSGAGDDETMKTRVQLAITMYTEFLREFQAMRTEHRALVSKLKEAKKTLLELPSAEIAEVEVAGLLNNNPQYRDLQSRLAMLESGSSRLHLGSVPPGTKLPPGLAQAQADYESTKARLEALEQKSREMIRAARRIAWEQESRRLEVQLEVSTEQLLTFEKEVEHRKNGADYVGRSSVAAQMARAEVDNIERILHGVAEELETLRVELKAKPRVQVLGDPNSPAAVPTCPD
jgi:uncharacterized protein involved in exopolysaccharide biosynthesis